MRRARRRLKTAKGRSLSSARWLERQLNDPYVADARAAGYRSRAAFKLIEIDDRFRLLRRGAAVVDLGAAPGGWTQVARERVGDSGRVVACDLAAMAPVSGADFVRVDFLTPEGAAAVRAALAGPAGAVLSDMAAPATGTAADRLRAAGLCEAAFRVRRRGPGRRRRFRRQGPSWRRGRPCRPHEAVVPRVCGMSSRRQAAAGSSEVYIVGLGFRRREDGVANGFCRVSWRTRRQCVIVCGSTERRKTGSEKDVAKHEKSRSRGRGRSVRARGVRRRAGAGRGVADAGDVARREPGVPRPDDGAPDRAGGLAFALSPLRRPGAAVRGGDRLS